MPLKCAIMSYSTVSPLKVHYLQKGQKNPGNWLIKKTINPIFPLTLRMQKQVLQHKPSLNSCLFHFQ